MALDQPDLGTAALFGIVGGGLLFLAGVSWLYFLAGFVGVIVVLPHVWERLHDYQQERILTFIDPERDPSGSGYHILQSKIAIGSGGFTGKGFMQGTQAQLNFLPEKHTDFIFTMFSEEMGFIGAAVLLALYLLALLFITYMALRCRSTFARLVAAGMGLCLFAYVFINVAMVTGLVPGRGRAAAARLLWRHLDADHDGGPGLRAQRPCQPGGPHQARGAWPVLVSPCVRPWTGEAARC